MVSTISIISIEITTSMIVTVMVDTLLDSACLDALYNTDNNGILFQECSSVIGKIFLLSQDSSPSQGGMKTGLGAWKPDAMQ